MSNRRYTSRLVRAVALWLWGTWPGRKALAAIVIVAAGIVTVASPREQTDLKGGWKGLANVIAPDHGDFALTGKAGGPATCIVRGRAGVVTGNGWSFKGDATVAERSCEGRIEKNGSVSLNLQLRLDWSGRIKGIGGDWESIDGYGDCEGELTGTLTAGGKWEAECKNDKYEWNTSFEWKPDASLK
ncbi:MAG: hypothetical protein JNK04_18645 [Myxococcales bacterium]|nr:hypothetical protein [Myxococcales bacterium]